MDGASNDCPLAVEPHQICPSSAMDTLCDGLQQLFVPARNPSENSSNLGVILLSNELPPQGDKIGSHLHLSAMFRLPMHV